MTLICSHPISNRASIVVLHLDERLAGSLLCFYADFGGGVYQCMLETLDNSACITPALHCALQPDDQRFHTSVCLHLSVLHFAELITLILDTHSLLPCPRLWSWLALLWSDGMKHHLVHRGLCVGCKALAPVVGDGVGKDVTRTVEGRAGNSATDFGVARTGLVSWRKDEA